MPPLGDRPDRRAQPLIARVGRGVGPIPCQSIAEPFAARGILSTVNSKLRVQAPVPESRDQEYLKSQNSLAGGIEIPVAADVLVSSEMFIRRTNVPGQQLFFKNLHFIRPPLFTKRR